MVHKTKQTTEKIEISWKTDFFRNPKKCVFRKIATDFGNRLEHQVSIILYAIFGLWPTSQYPTEQWQSILQPEFSIHFAHSGFGAKI